MNFRFRNNVYNLHPAEIGVLCGLVGVLAWGSITYLTSHAVATVEVHISSRQRSSTQFTTNRDARTTLTINAANLKSVETRNTWGRTVVAAGPDSSHIVVKVDRKLVGNASQGSTPLLALMHVVMSRSGRTLRLQCDTNGLPIDTQGRIDLDVRVPAFMMVAVHSDSGKVKVSGTTGGVHVDTTSGDVHLNLKSGDLSAKSYSGAIGIRIAHPTGNLIVRTSSGNIFVATGRSTIPISAALTSYSGRIGYHGDARVVTATTTSGDILINDPDLKPGIGSSIRSYSGSIALDLGEAYTGGVNARTDSGNLELPASVTNNGQPHQLVVQTTSGAIIVKKR